MGQSIEVAFISPQTAFISSQTAFIPEYIRQNKYRDWIQKSDKLNTSRGIFVSLKLNSILFFLIVSKPTGFDLNPADPRWIGNWWIGSLVGAFVAFLLAFVIMGFPRQLPRIKAQREEAIKNKDILANDQKISGNVKDIIPATKRLICNPVYVFQTLGGWAQ